MVCGVVAVPPTTMVGVVTVPPSSVVGAVVVVMVRGLDSEVGLFVDEKYWNMFRFVFFFVYVFVAYWVV